ncbi:hypothetical protein [uncultured Kocuria sp.]|uniref:hypothetical protein n=1 Tax=uncultured Kocuria sp. TaxID=259305 RepID=UPI00262832CD|nr:hypothetical protein [uncultured Kocuria sp.]
MPRPDRTAPVRRSSAVPVAAATVSAVLTLVLGTGYAVGRTVVAESPDGGGDRVPVSAWRGTHGVLHADEVSADGLRAEGWTLPTLASDGYRVVSMTRGSLSGHPVVAVRLHRGEDEVVVVEQRGRVDRENPMDGLTGLPVSAEGLEPVAVEGVPLWVDAGPPWRAVVVGDAVVYTVTGDSGPSEMARTVHLVVADERGRVVEPSAGDPGVVETVAAGLREIFG